MSPEEAARAAMCKPVAASKDIFETPFTGGTTQFLSFQNIRAQINAACATCHQAPAQNGGFTYVDSWQSAPPPGGRPDDLRPGFYETAERMRDYLLHADETKRMPPADRRGKNPQVFMDMGRQLNEWISAGKPNGAFRAGEAPAPVQGKPKRVKPARSSDLGNCIPVAAAAGFNYRADRLFETAEKLPKFLSETDLFTLDAYELAQNGTFAYNVEYPLWADNADKGRWVHVPAVMEKGEFKRQAITYDSLTGQFTIPENTRFYKSFYRAVAIPGGRLKMRRMETRVIVTRTPWEKSLFGTYQWDETEQVAMLLETPYRDGTAWKDMLQDVVVDEVKNTVRPYGIPGRQRCIDCHMGSPMNNFVLGFLPLQVNRRAEGEGGRLDPSMASDLDQVARLVSYGVLKGIKTAEELPRLETSGRLSPRNVHELRANGYVVGNCYHCHNPSGLAFTKENGIRLGLGPGELFQFDTQQRSVQIPTRRLVHQNGELDSSHIFRKVTDSQSQLGMFSQMPMHTPGAPDCRVQQVIGKWIRSFESEQAADEWAPECMIKKKENPFFWIDLDFTWVQSDTYVPRRSDWKDPSVGMPEKYRQIVLSDKMAKALSTEYPVGYWLKKRVCKFPEVDLPPEQRLPWMMRGERPKRPFGEIYATTPGHYFFRTTCMKCHGSRADGDSSLARGILNWSGGSVRVANLIEGMFGKKAENLKTFDLDGTNYAGQYLIWMAMEGTKVKFPPEISSFMGKHGGQMLNGLREKCLAQISTDKPSSPQFMDHEVFRNICFLDNLEPGHPELEFDPETNKARHPESVETWLDRAAWNSGWAIFEYLKTAAVTENFGLANDSCEARYGPEAPSQGETR